MEACRLQTLQVNLTGEPFQTLRQVASVNVPLQWPVNLKSLTIPSSSSRASRPESGCISSTHQLFLLLLLIAVIVCIAIAEASS
jgi:hypothetical protein